MKRTGMRKLRPLLFAAAPFWQLGLAPFADKVSWAPFGLPFQMIWQMAGIVIATLALGALFLIDEAGTGPEEEVR